MKSVRYSLEPANIPAMRAAGAYVARVRLRGSLGFEEVAARMANEGSVLTKPEILAAFDHLAVTLGELLAEGWRVNFGGIFDMFASVRGTFASADARYDPSENRVDVRARCGGRVRRYVAEHARPERVQRPEPAPRPLKFRGFGSGAAGAALVAGDIGVATGARLKFDPQAEDEGVFLVPVAGGEAVRAALMAGNRPRELVFRVPALVPGAEYWLEVRARVKGRGPLRAGRLEGALAAAATV